MCDSSGIASDGRLAPGEVLFPRERPFILKRIRELHEALRRVLAAIEDHVLHVLEQLRLLSNLETAREKILQIVLAGQPELEKILADPSLRQLRQRDAQEARHELASVAQEAPEEPPHARHGPSASRAAAGARPRRT